MKQTKKLVDNVINSWFGGGCPICNCYRTLTCGGSILNQTSKRYVECNTCGSKFKASFGVGSPKYKLIVGDSEYLGKELTLKEWKKVREDNLEKKDIAVYGGHGETINKDEKEKVCGILKVDQQGVYGIIAQVLVFTTNRIFILKPVSTAKHSAVGWVSRTIGGVYEQKKQQDLKEEILGSELGLDAILKRNKHVEILNSNITQIELNHSKWTGTSVYINTKNKGGFKFTPDKIVSFEDLIERFSLTLSDKLSIIGKK
jgi:hypothetical protein